MKYSNYLTETENKAAELLAKGKRLRDIRKSIGIEPGRNHTFYPFLAQLRLKTGIADVQEEQLCADYWKKVQEAPENPVLTKEQWSLLEWSLKPIPYSVLADRLHIAKSEVAPTIEATLALCGIFAKDDRVRRVQVRQFIATHANPYSQKMAPTTTDLQIIRAIADGENVGAVMGYNRHAAKKATQMACLRANIVAPGRGARRQLAQAYLASLEKREAQPPASEPAQPVTMDDPAFN